MRISVTKKPVIADVKSPAEPEQKKEDSNANTTNGLLSLCQDYGSDED